MRTAVYPGSFDPCTNGHMDVIKRASKLFDKVVVAVLVNNSKNPLFSVEKRVEMLKLVTGDLENVEITSFSGLLVDFMKKIDSQIIIKGIRAVSDFEYEFQMALANKKLYDQAETIFLTACTENMYLSSSVVKQIAAFNGDIRHFVPDVLHDEILQRLSKELPT